MDWINFQQLQYFNRIFELGSIARASREIKISPPALSMQLSSLEDRLGFKLFERKNKKLIPTDQAKDMYEVSKNLDHVQDDVLELINKGTRATNSKVKVGFNDGVPKSLSLISAKILLAVEKKLDISIEENNNTDLRSKLLLNEIDLAITNIPIIDPNGELMCQEFAKEQIAFYAKSKYAKLKKGFPHSFNNQNFILPSRHSDIRHSIDSWFALNKVNYGKIIEVQDSSVKKIFACEGLGIVPLPVFGAKSYVKSGELIKLANADNVYEKYYWVIKKNKYKEFSLIARLIEKLGEFLEA